MFNPLRPVSRTQRIIVASVVGPIAGLLLGLLYAMLYSMLRIRIEFSIVYVFLGIGLGNIIQQFGKGVGKEFVIIGAISGVIMVLAADLYPYIASFNGVGIQSILGSIIINYIMRFQVMLRNFSLYGLLNTVLYYLFRFYAIYYAARNSEVGYNSRLF